MDGSCAKCSRLLIDCALNERNIVVTDRWIDCLANLPIHPLVGGTAGDVTNKTVGEPEELSVQHFN